MPDRRRRPESLAEKLLDVAVPLRFEKVNEATVDLVARELNFDARQARSQQREN